MKVSHETPVSLLDYSKEYNDFDYCLVHLLHQNAGSPQQLDYYNFYKFGRSLYNREVLLDNSIFELGKAFDSAEFHKSVLDIQPNMYIVPDVLEDMAGTVQSFKEFGDKRDDIKNAFQTKTIGAVQGKNWHELKECYKFMSDNADMIAISFDFSYYQITGEGKTHLEKWCSGRQRFIQDLINTGAWNWNKPHHLLGCSLAKEFRYYVDRNICNIVSCDTSNPIVAAIHGLKYDADYGLDNKPSTKLADLIAHNFTDDQLALVKYNTAMFKKIVRR
jgi:hypothetical protein